MRRLLSSQFLPQASGEVRAGCLVTPVGTGLRISACVHRLNMISPSRSRRAAGCTFQASTRARNADR